MTRFFMESSSIRHLLFILLISCVSIIVVGDKTKCEVCKEMADNFQKGMEKTKNSNFGGGNTKWEEENLKISYLNSETRFIEITDNLCEESGDKSKCNRLFEKHEDDLESWWKMEKRGDLFKYLCLDTIKACCEPNHFGKSCDPCPGGIEMPCSGNGKCKGSGDREGKGTCECDDGYDGELCTFCKDGYFDETEENTKVDDKAVCKKCHESCKLICSGPESKNCDECKTGWIQSEDQGCIDVNECLEEKSPCNDVQYCENTVGSYKCNKCDAACATCSSKGSDNCLTCAPRYYMKDKPGLCSACHTSCDNTCTGPDSTHCDSCRSGWEMASDTGCVDVNECESGKHSCDEDKYCVNNEGSYKCISCDKSCKSCTGAGATSCINCNNGYQMVNDVCLDIDECTKEPCSGKHEKCLNTIGSYKCNCEEDYIRKSNKCVKKKGKNKKKKKEEL